MDIIYRTIVPVYLLPVTNISLALTVSDEKSMNTPNCMAQFVDSKVPHSKQLW